MTMMRTSLFGLLLLLTPFMAQAQNNDVYYTSPPSVDHDVYMAFGLGTGLANNPDFTQGGREGYFNTQGHYVATAALGVYVSDAVRMEVEGSYRNSELNKLVVSNPTNNFTISGDLQTTMVLGNLYYDFWADEQMSPYVSLGVGAAWHSGEAPIVGAGVPQTQSSTDTVALAYQAGAGASFAMTSWSDLTFGYRYMATTGAEISGLETDFNAHELLVGVRLSY